MTARPETGQPADFDRLREYAGNWPEHCRRFGFRLTEKGRRFYYLDDLWQIVGVDPKKLKYAIVCQNLHRRSLRAFSKTLVRACCPETGEINT